MHALVVGKFYPPHAGHHYLIDTALKHANAVDVLVVDNPAYALPAHRRQKWLQARHPKAAVHIISDINQDDNSSAWADHTINVLGRRPDIVFTSENYGEPYAKHLQARHVMVDYARNTFPVSGTKVRSDVLGYWQYLSKPVCAGLAIRVVVVGAESTGTTTLAKALAKYYRAPWVPETGRYYTHSIAHRKNWWTDADFHSIAKLQQSYEAELAASSDGIIICDTNATATTLWQKRYMKRSTQDVEVIARKDKVDLYILTDVDTPFVQDGTRDGEQLRHHMHSWFIEFLQAQTVPFVTATGSRKQRLEQVIPYIDKTIAASRVISKQKK